MDTSSLHAVPLHGPLLMIVNHVSVFEGPMLYVYMRPRKTIALAKRQLWDRLFTRKLMEMWGAIPVDRGMLDRESIDQCFNVLKRGDILCIAPEGTRSKDGALKQGKAGIAFIASKHQVPIIPVVTVGFEKFGENFRKFRRTPVKIIVGKPFEIIPRTGRMTPDVRQGITDEMMMHMAALMPPEYRGFYAESELPFEYTRMAD